MGVAFAAVWGGVVNAPERPAAPPSASWTPISGVPGSPGGVLAPEKPAQGVEAYPGVDFEAEPICEAVYDGVACSAPAVAVVTLACPGSCADLTLLKCRPHLKVVEDFIARCAELGWDMNCRACSGRLTWRVVPL